MRNEDVLRERQWWVAVTACLLTGAAWLAILNAALLLRVANPDLDRWMATARVLARAAAVVVELAAPIVVSSLLVALGILWIATAPGDGNSPGEGAQRA